MSSQILELPHSSNSADSYPQWLLKIIWILFSGTQLAYRSLLYTLINSRTFSCGNALTENPL